MTNNAYPKFSAWILLPIRFQINEDEKTSADWFEINLLRC